MKTQKTLQLEFNTRHLAMGGLLAALLCLLPALTRAETGVEAWVQRYNGAGTAIAVDSSNNVIVTGSSDGSGYGTNKDYATIKYSSAGVPLWTNRYNGPGNDADIAYAVAVDGSNNVIVTGMSGGYYSADYATLKYSSDGVPLWTNRYDGPENEDEARAIAVDGSNNVIVTGCSGYHNYFNDLSAYATIKYSSAGVPLWTNRYQNGWVKNLSSSASAVAVDGSNNVIVTGYSYEGGIGYDYATLKYSSDGVPLWTNRYDGPGHTNDYATAVAVDGNNDVIVTGYSFSNPTNCDYLTIKYSSAGVLLWTNRYSGPGNTNDYATAMAVDGNNDVIVTGYSFSNPTNCDYLTIKYSSAGVPLWTNRYDGPGNRLDWAYAVAVDGSNNVIVTGMSGGNHSADYATIKYSSAGVPLWTNRYDGPGNWIDHAYAVAVDGSNNVIVTGYSGSSSDRTNSYFATIKYICVPEPVMTNLSGTNGTFQMRVDGVLQPGTLVIEASTNLAGWEAVFTNTTPTNVLFYTDPEAATYPWRFYRAYQFP